MGCSTRDNDTTRRKEKHPDLDFDSRIFRGLPLSHRKTILKALRKYDDCFAGKGEKLGRCTSVKHSIDTGVAKLIRQVPSAKHGRSG